MSHGFISPCPCRVLLGTEVLWVLWSLSPDRSSREGSEDASLCYHRRRWQPATVTSLLTCVFSGTVGQTKELQLCKRINCTRAHNALVYMHHAGTQRHLSNHDSGIVWVIITQGEMLRQLKCVSNHATKHWIQTFFFVVVVLLAGPIIF